MSEYPALNYRMDLVQGEQFNREYTPVLVDTTTETDYFTDLDLVTVTAVATNPDTGDSVNFTVTTHSRVSANNDTMRLVLDPATTATMAKGPWRYTVTITNNSNSNLVEKKPSGYLIVR